jgi:hypothetical protein
MSLLNEKINQRTYENRVSAPPTRSGRVSTVRHSATHRPLTYVIHQTVSTGYCGSSSTSLHRNAFPFIHRIRGTISFPDSQLLNGSSIFHARVFVHETLSFTNLYSSPICQWLLCGSYASLVNQL